MEIEKINIKKTWLAYYFPGVQKWIFRKYVYYIVKNHYAEFWDNYEFISLITDRVIDKCVLKDDDLICKLKLQVYAQAEFSRAFYETINKLRNN